MTQATMSAKPTNEPCICGKNGYPLNARSCPVHGYDVVARHTSGPWDAGFDDVSWSVMTHDQIICDLAGYRNAEANARLVAAAPDLLKALSFAQNMSRLDADRGRAWPSQLTRTIDAALAKAQ